MAINFPNSPTDGQLYTVNGITYRYNSSVGAWLINANGITDTLLVTDTLTVNTSAIVGTVNLVPTIIASFAHANAAFDAANNAVTDFSPAFNQANAAYDQANTSLTVANFAFDRANTGGGGITYVRKTSNYTANTNEGVIADTSAGSFTVTLPASPNVGSQVIVVDGDNWAANTLTVSRNGLTIEGLSENLVLDIAGAAITFIYDGTTWETYAQIGISTSGFAPAYNQANAAFGQANTARDHANSAFDSSNTNQTIASASFDAANGAFASANASFDAANGAFASANAGQATANAAFSAANGAFASANAGQATANASFDAANGAFASANAGQIKANSSYNFANSAHAIANIAFDHANVSFAHANVAFEQANTARDLANTKFASAGGTISGDVSITGNLFVTGNVTSFSANNLVVNDPFVLLANNNTSDVLDIGFTAHYDSNLHTGLFRSAGTKEWYLFKNYDQHFFYEDNGSIDLNANNFTVDVLNADLKTSNLTLGGLNAISWLNSISTQANTAYNQANSAYTQANVAIDTALAFAIALG